MKLKLLFILLLFGTFSFSQKLMFDQRLEEANKLYGRALFVEALHHYQVLLASKPKDEFLYERYQYCLEQSKNPTVDRLEFMLEQIEKGDSSAQLQLDVARLYEERKDFENALKHYELFAKSASKDEVKNQSIKKKIKACKKALK